MTYHSEARMSKQLSADERKRVAEACCPLEAKSYADWAWEPESFDTHYRALVMKLAQEISELKKLLVWGDDEIGYGNLFYKIDDAQSRLTEALATNDTASMEALLLELLGDGV